MTTPSLPYLTFGAPKLGEEEIAEVVECLRSGWIGTGPRTARFEREFAEYKGLGPNYAAAVNSCTAALHISMQACGLSPGDEVITTPLTFCATVNAVVHAKLVPKVVDVDPVSWCIDPAAIEAAVGPRTRAILPVHFAGHPCRMDLIQEIAQRHQLLVIEDCAHAIETRFRGQAAGTIGDVGCFSFYATKNITTSEGGMVLSADQAMINRARVLSLHGMDKDAWHRFSDRGYRHYQVTDCGFKYNMTDLQAAIGIHQLARVEAMWARRREIWNTYQQQLGSLPLALPADAPDDCRHAYHLFPVQVRGESGVPSRDEVMLRLHDDGIGTGVHYTSLTDQPYYQQRFGWHPEETPIARDIGRTTLSLPLSPYLTDADVDRVCAAVSKALNVS